MRKDPTGALRLSQRSIEDGECVRWQGAKTSKGYGVISISGSRVYVHRLAYELHYGDIPEEMEIDHTCRVRDCVKIDHLEAVSHIENVRRSTRRVSKRECRRGHPFNENDLHIRPNGTFSCGPCWRESHAKRINGRGSEKVECECGKTVKRVSMWGHRKSISHRTHQEKGKE